MAILKPLKLDPKRLERLKTSFASQTLTRESVSRSLDPNYPVFRTPEGGYLLMYVPNHFTLDEAGNRTHLTSTVFTHRVQDGSRFGSQIRCIQGIVSEEDGLSGNCPLCQAAQTSWDWYNFKVEKASEQFGMDVKGSTEESARNLRAALLKNKLVDSPVTRVIFPVVVIELDANRKVVTDDLGKPAATPVFVDWSSDQYSKLVKAIVDPDDNCPAGRMFLLDYNYDTKGKKPTAMDAARNVQVNCLDKNNTYGFTKASLEAFDEHTSTWDDGKVLEVIRIAQVYPEEQLETLATETVKPHVQDMQQGVLNPVPAPAPASLAPGNSMGDVTAILEG